MTNITKISNRRINWIIGLEYKSTTKQLKTICDDIENKIISKKNFIVNDATPVIVKICEFSDSSINILVRCFTKTNDYNQLLEAKNELAVDIKEIVEKKRGLLCISFTVNIRRKKLKRFTFKSSLIFYPKFSQHHHFLPKSHLLQL